MYRKKNNLELDREYQLQKTRQENKVMLAMTAMILLTIISGITLIGLFWGKEGITNFTIGLFVITIITIVLFSTYVTSPMSYY